MQQISIADARSAFLRFAPKWLFGVLSALYLFSAGVFSPRHRAFIVKLCLHCGWNIGRPRPRLRPVGIDAITPTDTSVALVYPAPADGEITTLELMVIARIVHHHRIRAAFEIGTFNGRTALNIAANAEGAITVHTLDLPVADLHATVHALSPHEHRFVEKPAPGSCFMNTRYAGQIVQLYGDSSSFDYAPYAGTMDLVFIDGSHTAGHVRNDSYAARDLIGAGGGIILWHDYDADWPDVTSELDRLQASDPYFTGLQRIDGTSLAMLRVPPALR